MTTLWSSSPRTWRSRNTKCCFPITGRITPGKKLVDVLTPLPGSGQLDIDTKSEANMDSMKPVIWANVATGQFGFDRVEDLPRRTRGRAVTCMDASKMTRIIIDHLGPDEGQTYGIDTIVLVTGESIDIVRSRLREGVILPLPAQRNHGRPLKFAYRQVWAAAVLATFARAGVPLKILAKMAADLEAARQDRAEQRELMPAAAWN